MIILRIVLSMCKRHGTSTKCAFNFVHFKSMCSGLPFNPQRNMGYS